MIVHSSGREFPENLYIHVAIVIVLHVPIGIGLAVMRLGTSLRQ